MQINYFSEDFSKEDLLRLKLIENFFNNDRELVIKSIWDGPDTCEILEIEKSYYPPRKLWDKEVIVRLVPNIGCFLSSPNAPIRVELEIDDNRTLTDVYDILKFCEYAELDFLTEGLL